MTHYDLTVVVPWLQGGGAQEALRRLMLDVDVPRSQLVILFSGSRDHEPVLELFDDVITLDYVRGNPLDVFCCSRALAPHLASSDRVYSLMRASTVVLGMMPRPRQVRRFAASFHMLPADDRSGASWRVEEFFLRRALRTAELVTSPSQRSVNQLVSFGLSRPEVTYEVPNRLRAFSASLPPRSRRGAVVKLLGVGRLDRQKGFDRLARWLPDVEPDCEIRLAGEGPLRNELIATFSGMEGRHSVTLLGRVSDVTDQLDWCDAVIMPSRQELNPMVVWEAWQRGKPVIATSIDAFVDLAKIGPVLFANSGPEMADAVRRTMDTVDGEILRTAALRAVAGRVEGDDLLIAYLNGALAARA